MNESLINLLERALAMKRAGRRCAACLVVKARGSTPQSAGALMLVDEDLNTFGTIGGGCVEAEIRRQAHAMLAQGEQFVGGFVSFKLDHDYGWDDGLICGGTIDLAISPLPSVERLQQAINAVRSRRAMSLLFEAGGNSSAGLRACNGSGLRAGGNDLEQAETPALLSAGMTFALDIPPRDRLYIAGAGHVGQALARLAIPLEFEATIFDDREDLLKKFAPPGTLGSAGEIAERLREAPIDERTYVVIVTRGHKHDEQALHAVVGRGAKYVGMIGSRRKIKLIFDDLKDMGIDPKTLADVHAPIGLDIGSVSVEEIALSIAAEIIQVRRSEKHAAVRAVSETIAVCPAQADP